MIARAASPSAAGRLTAWMSQLANARGLYLGRRSTRIHVALYRWSRGRVGGHLPGWQGARIVERERLWSEFVDFYPGYEFFRAHAGSREIPIVVLDPR